jgi:hypothetical protein
MPGKGVHTVRTIVITVLVVVCLLALPGLLLGGLILAGAVGVGDPMMQDSVNATALAAVSTLAPEITRRAR